VDSGLRIVRREQSARSRQHRGVLTEAIYEGPSLEILRTEMETASAFDGQEFGDFSSLHFVIGGTPVFRTPHESVDLMPGDSIIFTDQRPYRVLNDAPSRSVILSVLFRAFDKESRA
jgi:mannose-6-phosphate isomerase-like protein (cupin superfamily)